MLYSLYFLTLIVATPVPEKENEKAKDESPESDKEEESAKEKGTVSPEEMKKLKEEIIENEEENAEKFGVPIKSKSDESMWDALLLLTTPMATNVARSGDECLKPGIGN